MLQSRDICKRSEGEKMTWKEIEEGFDKFKKDNSKAWRGIKLGVVGAVGLATLVGSFYTVDAREQAVVKRFGEYSTTSGPGWHFKIPFVDDAMVIETTTIHKEEFGFRTKSVGVITEYEKQTDNDEALMLTGDENIVDIDYVVQWKVKDAKDYLFKIRDPQTALRNASDSVMRRIVGDYGIDEILTTGKNEVEVAVRMNLQTALDSYESGIQVVAVDLKSVQPPQAVKDAFDAVNSAKQVRAKLIDQARAEYNSVIPAARGKAELMKRQADAYAISKVNNADGDIARFLKVREEFKKQPDITRKRMYLDTMEEVLRDAKEVKVIDGKVGERTLPVLKY